MNSGNAGDAGRVYQAVRRYAEALLWNDSRNADTFAWLVTGLLQSQKSTLPEWITQRPSKAQFAQSRERQSRRWLSNAKIDPVSIYGPLITSALQTWGEHRLVLVLRDRLGERTGMIFLYPQAEVTAMWMKNTRIPLSVAFIDGSGRILNIEDMVPFSEDAHGSRGPAAYALEVNRGWFNKRGIKAGDRVEGLSKLPPAK